MVVGQSQSRSRSQLGSDWEGVNCLAHDEAIMNPLVWERLEFSVLRKECAEDDNICHHRKYSYIRKTRAGGNCFYHAFGFSRLKGLLDDSKESQQFKAVSAKSKEDEVSQGFAGLTAEDFHHTFMDLNERVEKQTSVADPLASFNDQSTLDHLVIFLRLLPSGDLQWNSKFLEKFIEGGRTIRELCQQEVEPACKGGQLHPHPGTGPGAQPPHTGGGMVRRGCKSWLCGCSSNKFFGFKASLAWQGDRVIHMF
ncbi:hypothetical protein FD755_015065 [Muntiacus reevesi]|uniref:Ubiquitinyl hydrolase 1 n=1 Tax=Muntiacus reevesi TaxID=9886 RepID=A0A5N3XJJ5_MUNRE|nr:hypothetical protein FD755_015065 [Muntiacus reevesi]